MSEAEPGAERPEDSGAWTVPGAAPERRDPRDPQLAGGSGQHWEPTWPGFPAGGYQGGYPGGWPGPGAGWPGPGAGWPGPAGGGGGGRRSARLRQAATVVAVALVAAGAGAGIAYAVAGPTSPQNTAASGSTTPTPSQAPPSSGNPGTQPFGSGGQQPGSGGQGSTPSGSGAPANVGAIAAKVDPALVDVNVEFGYQDDGGAGTGIVLTSTGEVLTNNHVIDGATSISVTDIGNGKTYSASVVGYDNTHDMAVIQLHGASGLQTAAISSSAPTVGEPAVAIGNAGGVGGTPTAAGGSVTALDQSITASDDLDGTDEQLTGMIETNADVQSGDSGGSLVNGDGQVIGMDTAASSGFSFQSQSSGTQGFAIPISQAISTARQIESGDGTSVIHVGATAFLGVTISTSGSSGNGAPGSGFGNEPGQGSSVPGAVISGVVNGGAAQVAGLQAGDVITSLAGRTVGTATDLSKILVSEHPGDVVEIGWTDTAGQSHTATVDLGSGPAS
jgi:S1-C subfamily serine protease